MIEKILVGYDGSEPSRDALTFAVKLARTFSAEVHVVAVARPPDYGGTVETEAVIEQARRHCEHALRAARSELAHESFKSQFHVAVGHPAEQLVRYAEAKK